MLRVDEGTMREAFRLYKNRGQVDLSFTDATTAVVAKKQGITDLFTYDRQLAALGLATLSEV
jgi:predicted nucleic acid-binding protein